MAERTGSIKGVGSIVLIILAIVFLYWFFSIRGGDNPARARDIKVLTIDIITGEKNEAILKKGESFPLTDPDTGAELWKAYVNYDEKFLFPAQPGTMVTMCPITGNPKVGAANIKEHKGYPVRIPPGLRP